MARYAITLRNAFALLRAPAKPGLAIALVMLVAAGSARATTFAVDVEPAGAPAWQADALAAALTADLADNEFRAAKPLVRGDQGPPAADGVRAPADVVVHGELGVRELRYVITSPSSGVTQGPRTRTSRSGVVGLAGLDRHELAGRLRDELHAIAQPHAIAPGPPAQLAEPSGVPALVGLALVLGVLVAPLALAVALRQRVWRLRTAQPITVAIAGVVGFAFALEQVTPALVFLLGGLAWGGFAAIVLPAALPPLTGVQRVEHDELIPALAAWLVAALQRIAWFALLVTPMGFVVAWYGDAIGVSRSVALGVLAPSVGLVCHLAWLAIVEVVAQRLDRELVEPVQPWHPHVRAYFVGYLRRANLEVDTSALDRLQFLPGTNAPVTVYGGGLAPTRVVIPRLMLEHALAPYGRPHDYLEPRVSTLHWTHWNAGLVMPTEADAKLATKTDREVHETRDDGDAERLALGEPPTLAGIIEPVALDPRTSYRPGDDPLWLDWDPGEEYDGTDAGDKDYLFGVIVHALGMTQRREDRAATIALAWRRWFGNAAIARGLARTTAPLRAFAARQRTALGDVHVALGGARHHFAQYLAWCAWQRDDLVTARAYVPELEATSREIAAALDTKADPALRRRIIGLRVTTTRPARSRGKRLALVFAAVAGLAGVAALIVQAALYHDAYVERMTAQNKERAADGKRP